MGQLARNLMQACQGSHHGFDGTHALTDLIGCLLHAIVHVGLLCLVVQCMNTVEKNGDRYKNQQANAHKLGFAAQVAQVRHVIDSALGLDLRAPMNSCGYSTFLVYIRVTVQ